jgi:universal stress protein E
MSPPPLRKILCVIDPTTPEQRALFRAATIAQNSRAVVHAYLCFALPANASYQDVDEMRAAETRRHQLWLDDLVASYRNDDIQVTTEVECQDDWRGALAAAAGRAEADLIVRSSYRRTALQRRMLKTTDWTLLRESRCPVLLVKSGSVRKLDNVVVAVNVAAKDAPHQRLNDTVIAYAQSVAEMTGARLHAVNAFQGSMNFVHPPDLAKRVGVERAQAHVGDLSPEELIAEVVEKVGASLVIIGSLSRRGVSAMVVGNTAERILDNVGADVLTVFAKPD